jgi:hypothetical protein
LDLTEFGREIAALRGLYAQFSDSDVTELERNRRRAADRVHDVLHLMGDR